MENYKEILDKLVNDESSTVRAAVTRQWYGLDKLINDENYYVRAAAFNFIYENKPEVFSTIHQIIKSTCK